MIATIERSILAELLKRVAPATKGKGTPALACVLITASKGQLTVAATDLDWRITSHASAAVDTEGSVLVPHDILSGLVAKCPAGAVRLEEDAETAMLAVTAGKVKARLRCADVETFPREQRMDGAKTAKLGEDWHAIMRVAHAADQDQTKPILSSVHLSGGFAEATDSYRLARAVIASDIDMLLPASVLAAVDRAADGPLELSWQGRRFALDDGATTWQATAAEGEFPPVVQLLNSINVRTSVEFAVADLADAVGTVETLDRAERHVKLGVGVASIAVTAATRDIGDADMEIEAEGTGEPVTVGFNARYLLEALAVLDSDRATLGGFDHLKPWKMVEGDLSIMVMPVRMAG